MLGLDLSARHDRWYDALPRSPADAGTLETILVRAADGSRERPDEAALAPGRGLVGDAFERDEEAPPGSEVSLINAHVHRALQEGAPDAWSGDNLHVDLDLSEANLPAGTRLRVGDEVVLRVDELPHRPCGSFAERFGAKAAKRIARAGRRGLRGRGVLCTVVEGGTVRRGDAVRVER